MVRRLIILLLLAGAVALLVQSLPDIKRYVRIRRMLLTAAPARPRARRRAVRAGEAG
ncbi:hypothetical protein GCM10009530_07060 [Microbispora corallina]|uniref:Uncharacterized protein n=1 Tax=Microbispora corallina TaxID=83302 RepID=A0ABQ4FV25_9ACTN|nr:hypothetical protein [Microbispora corallina]GIH38669.1 hypothetical protein Mco01_16690 [Microbispora corallina]